MHGGRREEGGGREGGRREGGREEGGREEGGGRRGSWREEAGGNNEALICPFDDNGTRVVCTHVLSMLYLIDYMPTASGSNVLLSFSNTRSKGHTHGDKSHSHKNKISPTTERYPPSTTHTHTHPFLRALVHGIECSAEAPALTEHLGVLLAPEGVGTVGAHGTPRPVQTYLHDTGVRIIVEC